MRSCVSSRYFFAWPGGTQAGDFLASPGGQKPPPASAGALPATMAASKAGRSRRLEPLPWMSLMRSLGIIVISFVAAYLTDCGSRCSPNLRDRRILAAMAFLEPGQHRREVLAAAALALHEGLVEKRRELTHRGVGIRGLCGLLRQPQVLQHQFGCEARLVAVVGR